VAAALGWTQELDGNPPLRGSRSGGDHLAGVVQGLPLAPRQERSGFAAAQGQGAMAHLGRKTLKGDLEHRRPMAGQGPATQPAAAAPWIDADHLIELGRRSSAGEGKGWFLNGPGFKPDAGALLEIHGGGRRQKEGLNDFIFSTGAWAGCSRRAPGALGGRFSTQGCPAEGPAAGPLRWAIGGPDRTVRGCAGRPPRCAPRPGPRSPPGPGGSGLPAPRG